MSAARCNDDTPGSRRWHAGDEVQIVGPAPGLAGFLDAVRLSDGKRLVIATRATKDATVARNRAEWQAMQDGFRRLRQIGGA